jgi:hypothetical protein
MQKYGIQDTALCNNKNSACTNGYKCHTWRTGGEKGHFNIYMGILFFLWHIY